MQTSYRQQIRAIQKCLIQVPIESEEWKALNDAAGTIFAKSIEDSIKPPTDRYSKWYFYIATTLSFFGLVFLLETVIKAFLSP